MRKNKPHPVRPFLLIACLINQTSYSATQEELFKKAFGRSSISQTKLDVVYKAVNRGEVEVKLQDDKIIEVESKSLLNLLSTISKRKYLFESEWLNLKDLNSQSIQLQFDPPNLQMVLVIPLEDQKAEEYSLQSDLLPYYSVDAIRPAKLSYYLNSEVEKRFSAKDTEGSYLTAQLNPVINFREVALEGNVYHQSNKERDWYRGDVFLTKDFENQELRMRAGDVTPSSFSYLNSKKVGGISFAKDFSLNPYQNINPSSGYEFEITERSLVKIFINNSLIKTEYLPAGKHSIKDLPLNNGLNDILIETESALGEKRQFRFKKASSQDLLKENLNRYSFSTGYLIEDDNNVRHYQRNQELWSQAFWQRGLKSWWTSGVLAQGNGTAHLFGIHQLISTKIGNIELENAFSRVGQDGQAHRLTYQLNFLNGLHQILLRHENKSLYFSDSEKLMSNTYKNLVSSNYSFPLFSWGHLGIGGSYGQSRRGESFDKKTLDLSYNCDFMKSGSFSLSWSQMIAPEKENVIYAYFNIPFDDNEQYFNAFYESRNQSKRVTYYKDNGNRDWEAKAFVTAEESSFGQSADADLSYNFRALDVGIKNNFSRTRDKMTRNTFSVRAASALGVVGGKVFISRPIRNSFAVISAKDAIKGQKFGVISNERIQQADSNLFGHVILTDLAPYQYRRVQLDSSRLEKGYTLGKESYALFPTYKSGHSIKVGVPGFFILKSYLLDEKNSPLKLVAGTLIDEEGNELDFFTNRDGKFVIENLQAKKYKIEVGEYRGNVNLEQENKPGEYVLPPIKLMRN